jgi:hypothetical protein
VVGVEVCGDDDDDDDGAKGSGVALRDEGQRVAIPGGLEPSKPESGKVGAFEWRSTRLCWKNPNVSYSCKRVSRRLDKLHNWGKTNT